MRVCASIQDPASYPTECLAVGVFEAQNEPTAGLAGAPFAALVARLLATKEVPTGVGDTLPIFLEGQPAESLLLFGLGSKEKFDAGVAFAAGVAVSKRLATKERTRVAASLIDAPDAGTYVSPLVEGLIAGTQSSGLRKSERTRHPFGELALLARPGSVPLSLLERETRRGEIVGGAINLARELADTPPSEKPPARLADRARAVAIEAGITVEIWDEARLRQERFGGLLGVASGSSQPPAFVTMHYRGAGDQPTCALVGKGVTFDSGGLSLKPIASMEDMKADMTGAAVVLATMQAAARLALPVNLDGYLVLTENMTGGSAMKLGDVLVTRNGTTVEVLNTDAEGRLILADALSYAVEQNPARLLDLATLTGACVVALGARIAGLFSNNQEFADQVLRACHQTGERAWPMPLHDDFQEAIKSKVADLRNVGGKAGGAITAAKFLERFVGNTPWVHLDIAGPSWADEDSPTRDAGATGCFVRTLVTLFEAHGAASTRL